MEHRGNNGKVPLIEQTDGVNTWFTPVGADPRVQQQNGDARRGKMRPHAADRGEYGAEFDEENNILGVIVKRSELELYGQVYDHDHNGSGVLEMVGRDSSIKIAAPYEDMTVYLPGDYLRKRKRESRDRDDAKSPSRNNEEYIVFGSEDEYEMVIGRERVLWPMTRKELLAKHREEQVRLEREQRNRENARSRSRTSHDDQALVPFEGDNPTGVAPVFHFHISGSDGVEAAKSLANAMRGGHPARRQEVARRRPPQSNAMDLLGDGGYRGREAYDDRGRGNQRNSQHNGSSQRRPSSKSIGGKSFDKLRELYSHKSGRRLLLTLGAVAAFGGVYGANSGAFSGDALASIFNGSSADKPSTPNLTAAEQAARAKAARENTFFWDSEAGKGLVVGSFKIGTTDQPMRRMIAIHYSADQGQKADWLPKENQVAAQKNGFSIAIANEDLSVIADASAPGAVTVDAKTSEVTIHLDKIALDAVKPNYTDKSATQEEPKPHLKALDISQPAIVANWNKTHTGLTPGQGKELQKTLDAMKIKKATTPAQVAMVKDLGRKVAPIEVAAMVQAVNNSVSPADMDKLVDTAVRNQLVAQYGAQNAAQEKKHKQLNKIKVVTAGHVAQLLASYLPRHGYAQLKDQNTLELDGSGGPEPIRINQPYKGTIVTPKQ